MKYLKKDGIGPYGMKFDLALGKWMIDNTTRNWMEKISLLEVSFTNRNPWFVWIIIQIRTDGSYKERCEIFSWNHKKRHKCIESVTKQNEKIPSKYKDYIEPALAPVFYIDGW